MQVSSRAGDEIPARSFPDSSHCQRVDLIYPKLAGKFEVPFFNL